MNRRSMVFSLRRNRTHSLTARVLKKTLCGTQISESIMIFTMTLSTIEAIRVHWHEYLRPCSDVTIPARPQVLFFTCCNHRWDLTRLSSFRGTLVRPTGFSRARGHICYHLLAAGDYLRGVLQGSNLASSNLILTMVELGRDWPCPRRSHKTFCELLKGLRESMLYQRLVIRFLSFKF